MAVHPMRSLLGGILVTAGLLLWGGTRMARAGSSPPAVTLLPADTVAIISVGDVPDLARRFMNTAWGHMTRDPSMRPLVDQLYKSLAEATERAKERLGLSLEQLAAIPQGEATLAVVAPEEGPPAFVLLVDAGDHLIDAHRLMETVPKDSLARRSDELFLGTKLVIYQGVFADGKQPLIFFEKQNSVVMGSNLDVLKKILAVWKAKERSSQSTAKEAATLVDNPTFNALMSHCQGLPGETPQAVFYLNPLLLVDCIGRNNPQAMMMANMLPLLGLDGLQAFGGSIAWDVGEFDTVVHAHLLLSSPRTGVLKAIALGTASLEPEKWVPSQVAQYTTLQVEPETVYKTVTGLYDGFRGEGAFAEAVTQRLGRITAMDFEKEILPTLDGRVTYMTWIERPVSLTSQATLVGLKLKDAESLAKVLDRVVSENGPFLEEHTVGGKKYFQYSPPQLSDAPSQPAAQPAAPARRRRPRPCFGLLDDYLLITDRASLFEEAIRTTADPSKSLSHSADFGRVADEIRRRAKSSTGARGQAAMVTFERPEEGMRVMYEMAVAERSRERLRRAAGRNPFARSLNTALEAHPLPPFAVLERYLAPQGTVLVDDASGLDYISFTLRPKTQ